MRMNFFQDFFKTEAAGGALLLVCACAALVVANSPWAHAYHALWATTISVGSGEHVLTLTLHQWINDGLMALFFLLVGLEIKREFLAGELSSLRHAALPIVAAIGGVVVPASVFLLVIGSGPESRGWAIAMATDIAFALGALAIVAPKAPSGLKVFLAALAIVDDIAAVLVIALFYTGAIDSHALAMAGLCFLVLFALNRLRVRWLTPYLLVGVVLWFFVHESGIHATVAGVLIALAIPARSTRTAAEFSATARGLLDEFDRSETGDRMVLTSKGQQDAIFARAREPQVATPLARLEHSLHGLSAFVVMPLFAFSNAGVSLRGVRRSRHAGGLPGTRDRQAARDHGGRVGVRAHIAAAAGRELVDAARVRVARGHRVHDVALHRGVGVRRHAVPRLGQARDPGRLRCCGEHRRGDRPRRAATLILIGAARDRLVPVSPMLRR